MTDRELLERAAKAAGIENLAPQGNVIICNDEDGYSAVWNPLTDDGDAFRLAVKLGIDLTHFDLSELVEAWKHPHQACGEDYSSDKYAATRRAIVRAAAAMAV